MYGKKEDGERKIEAYVEKGKFLLECTKESNKSLSEKDPKKHPVAYNENLKNQHELHLATEAHAKAGPLKPEKGGSKQNKEIPDNPSLARIGEKPETITTFPLNPPLKDNKTLFSKEKVTSDLTKSLDQSKSGTDTSDTLSVAGFTF